MIIGIIVDRMVDYMMIPRFNKWKKLRVKKQSKQLYLGKKTVDYVRQYYSDHLYNCKIKKWISTNSIFGKRFVEQVEL